MDLHSRHPQETLSSFRLHNTAPGRAVVGVALPMEWAQPNFALLLDMRAA